MNQTDAQYHAMVAERAADLPDGWTVRLHVRSDATPIREDIHYDHQARVAQVTFNPALYDRLADLDAEIVDTLALIADRIERREV